MDARSSKIAKLWMLMAQSDKIPRKEIAGAVYFAATNQPPPSEVREITTALDLCDYLSKQETEIALSHDERVALAQEIVYSAKASGAPNLKIVRFVNWLPNVVVIFAIATVIVGHFSWIVLGLGFLSKIQVGFAKYLAGQGHQAAGLHIAISLFFIVSTLVVSILHLFSDYSFA